MKRFLLATTLLSLILLLPGCMPASADCQQAEVFCVGLVTSMGQRDDRAFNQAAWEGIEKSRSADVVDRIASIETADVRDYEENIAVFAEAGYDVIVTIGSEMGDVTRASAVKFPDSYFIGLDQDQSTSQVFSPNMTGLIFPEDQMGYLAGALGALMSNTGQIGAVCASDAFPAMKRYGDGFIAGAAYIDPQITTSVIYHNEVDLGRSMDDPEWGASQSNALIDLGSDIVFGVGGSTGANAIVAAVSRGVFAIGAETDQYYTLPVAAPHIIVSVLKMIPPAVTELIKFAREAQAGTSIFPSVNYMGKVGLSPYHDMSSSVPDEIKLRMEELVDALNTGEIQMENPLPALE